MPDPAPAQVPSGFKKQPAVRRMPFENVEVAVPDEKIDPPVRVRPADEERPAADTPPV